MLPNLQGLHDEFESAGIAVDALTIALTSATVFNRPGILNALREAQQAHLDAALELLAAMAADLDRAQYAQAA